MAGISADRRQSGRPRLFEDADAFRATAEVLAKVGHERMSLNAIADEIGCSAPALIARFGSKRSLLRLFLEWSNAQIKVRFDQARDAHQSPLEAIRARVCLDAGQRTDEIADPEGYANMVAFYLVAWRDETLGAIAEERRQIVENEFESLLQEAIAHGEIVQCNPRLMAETLLTAFTGCALQWIGRPFEPMEVQMGKLFDVLIDPYRGARQS